MGVVLMNSDMPICDEEDGYLSDAEAFSSVMEVLDGVAMVPNMIAEADRDQYSYLLSIVDPMVPDEEALLVTTLKALSGSVSKIDIVFHETLLSNVFSMCIWNYGLDTRNALLELIISLAAVPEKFLDSCLQMIVNNFLPRSTIRHPRLLAEKKKIHSLLHRALHYIAELVPLAPMRLKDIMDKSMPRFTDPKEAIVMFVECMLGLERDDIGEFLGSTLMPKVVNLLTDLDVNISWEEILQEEHNKGIFEMELEDVEENGDRFGGIGTKPLERTGGVLKGNPFAEKLDGLMVIMFEHLKSCAYDGHLVKVFETLTESFRKTVMTSYKSKVAQFVMFYACSLDPDICGLKFAVLLTDIFVSRTEGPNSRMSAVSYLASFLSRAKFMPSSLVASILQRLVDWCSEYCQFQSSLEKAINPRVHRVFYSGCQAVMYILCFRMRSLMDVPNLKSLLFHLPLEPILSHPLDPLKVCLPSIVHEFLRQAKAANLFKTSTTFLFDNLLESEFSKAFGGIERLDMFFPFDPYMLKESDRFIRPYFEYWSMVKTTYSNCNSEDDEDEDYVDHEDIDAFEFASNVDTCEGHDNLEVDSEVEDDDNLDLSMNKMSITPKPSFHFPMAANIPIPSRMPAKLRPSVSPDF